MRLIEDLPTRQVFERRVENDGTYRGVDERPLQAVLLIIFALVAATLAIGQFKLIQQGNIEGNVVRDTVIFTLVSLGLGGGGVGYFWRLLNLYKNWRIRYVFDLTTNTLTIENTLYPRSHHSPISAEKYSTFIVEFVSSRYHLTLLDSVTGKPIYQVYSNDESPPDEFIYALKRIGLQEIVSQQNNE